MVMVETSLRYSICDDCNITDAYLMYVFDQKNQQDHQLLTRQAFIERLAYEMIHNNITPYEKPTHYLDDDDVC